MKYRKSGLRGVRNMSEFGISIIVPVYNVEEFLDRCIKSLLTQTFKNLEIILVDDGSTDASGMICDRYANEKSIIVIHKKNGGLSSARNTGIIKAKGKYIMFVDSDDYINNDSCEKLYREAEQGQYDIVAADAYILKGDGSKKLNNKKRNIKVPCNGIDFLVSNISQNTMSMCAPYGIYKRELILNNSIFFKEGILHEDELWTPQVYISAKQVSYISFAFYYHNIREGSITTSKWNVKRGNDIAEICFELAKIYKKKIINNNDRRILMDYLCSIYLYSLNMTRNKNGDKYFLRSTGYRWKSILKTFLYIISPEIYFLINPHRPI